MAQDKAIAAVIDDARALMDSMLEKGWKEVFVSDAAQSIFIAATDGGANPLLQPAAAPEPASAPVAVSQTITETALHVATLVTLPAVGTVLTAGDTMAMVSILDEPENWPTKTGGRVVAHLAAPGDLIEFGMAVVQLEVPA